MGPCLSVFETPLEAVLMWDPHWASSILSIRW